MRKYTLTALGCAVVAAALGSGTVARAASVASFAGGSGNLAAQVVFTLDGSTLNVALTNTSGTAAGDNPDVLTAVFWDSSRAIGGTFTSVALGAGSSIIQAPKGSAADVGSYGYGTSFSGAPGNDAYGFSAAGFTLSYDRQLDLNGNVGGQLQGGDGGLVSAAGLAGSPSNGLQGPLVNDTVVFTITGVSSDFSLADLSDIQFRYGTSLGGSDVGFPGDLLPPPSGADGVVPLPSSALTGGVLAAGLALVQARRRRHSRPVA